MNVIKNELLEVYHESKWLPLITAYSILSIIIGPGLHYPMMHLPFILFVLAKTCFHHFKLDTLALIFLLYIPLNILLAQPAAVFRSWQRLALFTVVFLFASPILKSEYIGLYRRKILMGLLAICAVLGIGSFVCYFLGINYMRSQFDGDVINYYQTAGGFGGLITQSISLGFVSGLGGLYLLYRALQQEAKERKWYYVGIAVLLATVLLSSSRAALISTLIGGLMMIYQANRNNGKFFMTIMSILVVGMLTLPLWEGLTQGLQAKNKGNVELGKYGSRTMKWEARISEFESSPLIGVGFVAQDPHGKDYYDRRSGTVEPGSSWLAILSMLGIVGFVIFAFILYKPYKYLSSNKSPYNALMLGLLAFICMHMIAEGYILAGGSSLCCMAWLIIACCHDATYLKWDEEETE